MDIVMHIFGTCSDAHAHFDLMDLILMGGGVTPILIYIKYKWSTIKSFINGRYKRRTNTSSR